MTVRRAKEALSVVAQKSSFGGGWEWRREHAQPEDARPSDRDVSTFEHAAENAKLNGNGEVKDAQPIQLSTFGSQEDDGEVRL